MGVSERSNYYERRGSGGDGRRNRQLKTTASGMHIPASTDDGAALDFGGPTCGLAELRKVIDDGKPSHETSMNQIADGAKSDPETDDGEDGVCESR